MLRDGLIFLREGLVNFYYTGSLFPTTRWAAFALTDPIRKHSKPQNILEVGAGTGSVTTKILEEMSPGDHLTICEVNPRFMSQLKKKLEKNDDFQVVNENIQFYEGLIQDLPEDVKYDVIISALPFLNFDVSTVHEIFSKLNRLSRPEATLAYYEYIGLRHLGKVLPLPQRRQRIQELDGFFREQSFAEPTDRTQVWLNILPINVYQMSMVELEDPRHGYTLQASEQQLNHETRPLETSEALS